MRADHQKLMQGKISRSYATLGIIYFALLTSPSLIAEHAKNKAEIPLHAKNIGVEIVGVHPDPDDSSDSIITVQITVQSADQSLVIPNCAHDGAPGLLHCTAQMRRKNGKVVGLRNRLAATLGFEEDRSWKPITIEPNSQASFRFSVDTQLLEVRTGETVRVGFQVWPNAESMKDWKAATTLMSPTFKGPATAR